MDAMHHLLRISSFLIILNFAPSFLSAAEPVSHQEAKILQTDRVAEFYKGKTIRLIVGYGPGGGYDRNARILAAHLNKHVPGAPSVIVVNKPGAGSAVAANSVYASEPNDGTVIVTFDASLILRQAIGADEIKFNAAKFTWLGSVGTSAFVCVARRASVHGLAPAMGGQLIVLGTTGVGSTPHTIPAALNEVLGTNFKLVPGYTGIPQVRMAVEAGEVDGFCQGWTTLVTESRSMLEGQNPLLKPLVVVSDRLPPHPLLRELPTADELARTQDDKDTMRTVYAPTGISFPFAVGPNVPIDRALALRSAVAKALADPGLIADMQKAGQILEPLSGEEIQDTVEKILSAPRGSLDRIKKILAN